MSAQTRPIRPPTPPRAPLLAKAVRIAIVAATYAIVAAIVVNLYMLRWGLRDGSERYGFTETVTYESYRPFVYRLFMPVAINGLAELVPERLAQRIERAAAQPPREMRGAEMINLTAQEKLGIKIHRAREMFRWAPGDEVKRLIAYGLMVILLFGAQICLRFTATTVYHLPSAAADFAPAVTLLFLPLTFLGGGYLYDFADVCFISLTTLFLLRGSWWLYYAAFALAVFNKETSVLFILALWALYARHWSIARLAGHSALHVVIGSAIVLPIRWWFRDNRGAGMEWHLEGNLAYYLRPTTYLDIDDVYAPFIFHPTFFNLVLVFFVIFVALYAWRTKPASIRRLFLVLFLVLLPLFIVGGWRNEVRVFYLCLPAYFLLALHTLHVLYVGDAPKLRGEESASSTRPATVEAG